MASLKELNERLLNAACAGNVDEIASLLDQGADINAQIGERHYTPLISALHYQHESAALFLLKRGARVDLVDGYGETPLGRACCHGLKAVAGELLRRGADATVANYEGTSPLHLACGSFSRSLVITLLDKTRSNPYAKTRYGETCLHYAACGGSVEICKLLLERGLPVDPAFIEGSTPLHEACIYGHAQVAALLLDQGADIDRRNDLNEAPIHCALRSAENGPIILLLLERSARLDGPLPRCGFYFPSLDAALATALEHGFLKTLFNKPKTPIPPYRRAIHWALNSPAVAALVEKNKWSLANSAKTPAEAEEMKKKRMSLLNAEGWERRKEIVIDRALDWGYGYSAKEPEAKKSRIEEKKAEAKGE